MIFRCFPCVVPCLYSPWFSLSCAPPISAPFSGLYKARECTQLVPRNHDHGQPARWEQKLLRPTFTRRFIVWVGILAAWSVIFVVVFPVHPAFIMKRRWTVLKTTPLHLKWLFSIWPLNFWYLTIGSLIKKNLFFFLMLPLDQIAIEPLNFKAIYKSVLGFQFNQFTLQLIL